MSYNPLKMQGLWPWLLQRVSAAFLVIGMLVHFWALHFYLDKPLDFEDVWLRFRTPGWIVFDLLLLIAALYHGLNGVWGIFNDYLPKPGSRKVVGWVLVVVGVLCFLWGVYILAPFATLTPGV
jgi:succinate dehydrogenase / fumarate reductase membrane anchor subunit